MENEKLMEQLEIVRHGGNVNMLDFNGVLHDATNRGLDILTDWMHDHTFNDYGKMLFGEFSNWRMVQDEEEFGAN